MTERKEVVYNTYNQLRSAGEHEFCNGFFKHMYQNGASIDDAVGTLAKEFNIKVDRQEIGQRFYNAYEQSYGRLKKASQAPPALETELVQRRRQSQAAQAAQVRQQEQDVQQNLGRKAVGTSYVPGSGVEDPTTYKGTPYCQVRDGDGDRSNMLVAGENVLGSDRNIVVAGDVQVVTERHGTDVQEDAQDLHDKQLGSGYEDLKGDLGDSVEGGAEDLAIAHKQNTEGQDLDGIVEEVPEPQIRKHVGSVPADKCCQAQTPGDEIGFGNGGGSGSGHYGSSHGGWGKRLLAYGVVAALAVGGIIGAYYHGKHSMQSAAEAAAQNRVAAVTQQYTGENSALRSENESLKSDKSGLETKVSQTSASLAEAQKQYDNADTMVRGLQAALSASDAGSEKPADYLAEESSPKADLPAKVAKSAYDKEGSVVDYLRSLGFEEKGNLWELRTRLYEAATNRQEFTVGSRGENNTIFDYVRGKTKNQIEELLKAYEGSAASAAPKPDQTLVDQSNPIEPLMKEAVQVPEATSVPVVEAQDVAQPKTAPYSSANEARSVGTLGNIFEIALNMNGGLKEYTLFQKDQKDKDRTVQTNAGTQLQDFPFYNRDIATAEDLAAVVKGIAKSADGIKFERDAFERMVDRLGISLGGPEFASLTGALESYNTTEDELDVASQAVFELLNKGYYDAGNTRIGGYESHVKKHIESMKHGHKHNEKVARADSKRHEIGIQKAQNKANQERVRKAQQRYGVGARNR